MLILVGAHALLALASGAPASPPPVEQAEQEAAASGCATCHAGIEDMHPEAELTCVDCHGGDPTATSARRAHVERPRTAGEDESVWPPDRALAWRRFANPMDLRVAGETCGECHASEVRNLLVSLHGTTAGHLSDGYYEVGLLPERGSRFAVFETGDAPRAGGAVDGLEQVPRFRPDRDRERPESLEHHYGDLARKECMQCHLWSQGAAVRGRVGFDGDYRGEGCAACHVEYALDGRSSSGDAQRRTGEPGHPRRHVLTRSAPTSTCVSCHNGDASIGLSFRGLSQLPPNAPGGPDIPGTTDRQQHREFFLDDPAICPPDLHHERGMHCVDCHTKPGVMGDGRMHGQMEHAVEITCEACHGTPERVTELRTQSGLPLEHMRWEDDRVLLVGKVSGKTHVVPQAAHVVDPVRPEYNAHAARAMTGEHARLRCYACHAGWNPNFLGFHFSRNASLSQRDLLSGERTPGRVTTQEKVFATWKSLYLGLDEEGRVAPYMTGFSTMGSAWNEEGELVLDQAMPRTAAGLSGMTMVHHQVHTTRDTARSCVECHRSSSTWGMGSANFRLGRQLGFVADRRGIEVVAFNRLDLGRSLPLLKIPLPDVVALALACDPIQGHARTLFAAEGYRGVHVYDVSDPLRPRRTAFVATVEPRALLHAGGVLYVADGPGGLRMLDVSDPSAVRELGRVPTFDAQDVALQWPYAYVADGAGGLALVDVRAPEAADVLRAVDLWPEASTPLEAFRVATLFQYSRPIVVDGVATSERTPARHLCAVLDRRRGLILVDVTEPWRPLLLHPSAEERRGSRAATQLAYRGLVLRSQVDPAEAQGGDRTRERDYAYLLVERGTDTRRSNIRIEDVTDPLAVEAVVSRRRGAAAGTTTEALVAAELYSPPFRRRILFAPGERGVYMVDASLSREPDRAGLIDGIKAAYAIAVEEFPLDRMLDERGRRLKDVSREDSRWLTRDEIERVLAVDRERLDPGVLPVPAEPFFGEAVFLLLEQADRDGSGFLEEAELSSLASEGWDRDGDGRVALLELAAARHALHLGVEDGSSSRPALAPEATTGSAADGEPRTLADGDLARLLDGLDPYAFDRDRGGGLDRRELEQAFFAALDLDGDEALTPDELSRHPGEWRALRFGDARARARFAELERKRDGRLVRREYRLPDADWEALDADGDGEVELVPAEHDFQRARGAVREGSEWPARRGAIHPLAPNARAEDLLAAFDADGDGTLTRAELRARPDLFALLDHDRSGSADEPELDRVFQRIRSRGADACVDDFLGRWDLDGSGAVEEHELARVAFLRLEPFLGAR